MKKIKNIFFATFILTCFANSQFKSQAPQRSIVGSFVRPSSLLDFQSLIDPSKLIMRQQYSVSYSSFGNNAISLGQYTNSMMYQFNQNLNARVDVTMQQSLLNSAGVNSNALNGVFINRAEINYNPIENLYFRLSYQKMPFNYDRNYYGYPNYDPLNNW